MAKHERLRAAKLEASSHQARGYTSATLLHPTIIEPKQRSIARSHAKHVNDFPFQGPAPFSLADRFHALPTELRFEIFSLLLMRPVKWDLDHQSSCPLVEDHTKDLRPESYSCVRCGFGYRPQPWRRHTTRSGGWDGASENPWRSKYAPKTTNEFMCTDCWDETFRADITGHNFPLLDRDMPCLCARRTDLDVLLVCRQWYEEASRVLWTSNTFAFGNCKLLTSFAVTCSAADRVTRISLLNRGQHHGQFLHLPFEWPDWAYHKQRKAAITALRKFLALTHLELDSCFLRDVRDVQALLRVGMKSLRRVRFVYHEVAKPADPSVATPRKDNRRIHPTLNTVTLPRGGLAEEVARAMKGQHRAWTKHRVPTKDQPKSKTARKRQKPGTSLLQTAVKRHIAIEDGIKYKQIPVPPHLIINCDDDELWAQLWWKTSGRLHWSQSFLPLDSEQYEPQGWSKGMKREEGERRWWRVFPFANWDLTDWIWEDEFPFAGMKL